MRNNDDMCTSVHHVKTYKSDMNEPTNIYINMDEIRNEIHKTANLLNTIYQHILFQVLLKNNKPHDLERRLCPDIKIYSQ